MNKISSGMEQKMENNHIERMARETGTPEASGNG
jgi:hypothetical protein